MAKKSTPEEHVEEHIDMAEGLDESAGNKPDLKDSDADVDTPAADAAAPAAEAKTTDSAAHKDGHRHKVWWWIASHKKVVIPVTVLLVLAVLAAIPSTRYFFAGMVVRKDFNVVVVDSQTNKPVTSASVTLAGQKVVTDSQGKAKVHANVGDAKLVVSKKYYKDTSANVLVPFSQKQPYDVKFEATGRPVPITVINKISNKPVADVTISAENTQAITDSTGEATLVVPADKPTIKATLSGKNYNKVDVTLKVTAAVDAANKFSVTPSGKLYFLSNASGKLDVMKSDLDGQNRQLVLAGTGKEEKNNTVLLASRDWKYVTLLSKRDGGDNAKLFLIETGSDKLTTMDEGDATFSPYGWSGSRFVYSVNRTKVDIWQPKRQALKSYEATSGAITVLDQTAAEGDQTNYRGEALINAYIFDKEIVFAKSWQGGGAFYDLSGKQATLNSIQADGSQRKIIKGYSPASPGYYYVSIETQPGAFNELYIRYLTDNNKSKYDEYEGGKLAASDFTDEAFYQSSYNTYIVSPSGNKTFWTEFRDGKNVFFVGDSKGENGKQLPGSSDDHTAYGWYSDDYLLVAKKSSEMHIMPVDGLPGGVETALKISDYYKPNYYIRGYGYGYGG